MISRPEGVSNDSTAAKPRIGAPQLLNNLHKEALDALATRATRPGSVNDGGSESKSGAVKVSRPEDTAAGVIGQDGSIHFVDNIPIGIRTPENVTVDKQGRVVKVSYPNQTSTQFSYNDGKLNKITPSDGQVAKLINGKWTTEADPSSKNPALLKPVPIDMTGVQVNIDGSWSYSNYEGAHFATNIDGTHTVMDSEIKMNATRDPNYNLTSITLDGKTYKSTNNKHWVSADGKASNMMDFNVFISGAVYYEDEQTGQGVRLNPDGSKDIANGGDVKSNSRGQIESISIDSSFSSFKYNANGQICSYSANGDIYSSKGGGIFKDKNGTTISQLQVSSQGDVTYLNQADKLVSDNINGVLAVSAEKISPDNSSVTANTNGEVTAVTYADGSSRQFSYNQNRQLTGFTYSKGETHKSYSLKNAQWFDSHGSNMGWSQVNVNGAGSFSYTKQRDGTTITALTDGSEQTFSQSGFSFERNRHGQVVQYSDGHGNTFDSINGVFKSMSGDTLTVVNNESQISPPGHGVASSDDADGASSSYLVQNAKHQPVEVIYSNGQSRRYNFNAHGHVNQIIQPDGNVDKLKDGRWLQRIIYTNSNISAPALPGQPDEQSWIPSNFTNVQVGSDGALSYRTAQNAQVTYYGDGTSSTHTKDYAFVNADLKGNVTSVVFGNGDVSSFTYGANGQLVTVNDKGTDYYKDTAKGSKHGEWLNAQGHPSNKTAFHVNSEGTFSYDDTETGQAISNGVDGTAAITYTDGSTLLKNSAGQIVTITPGSGGAANTESFSYDAHGSISQFTASKGQVYSRQANGDFADKLADTLSNVQLSTEGNLSYVNGARHVVIASRSGTTFTSVHSATQLSQAAETIHSLQSACSLAPDNRIGDLIDGLGPADLAALQVEYKQRYGKDLSSDLATNVGASASSIARLLSANIEMTTGRRLPAAPKSAAGEQIESDILLAYKLGVPVSDSAKEVLSKAALAQSDSQIKITDVEQGSALGDCVFEAALAAVANAQGGAQNIQKMITSNSDGSFTVTFPGDKSRSVTVTEQNIEESGTEDSSPWATIVETAMVKNYSALSEGNVPKGAPGGTDGNAPSSAQYALYLLTGNTATKTDTSDFSIGDKINQSLSKDQPVTAYCQNDDNGALVSGHEWTVESYDQNTQQITVRNPWGSNPHSDASRSGITDLADGQVRMSLTTFQKYYGEVTLGTV